MERAPFSTTAFASASASVSATPPFLFPTTYRCGYKTKRGAACQQIVRCFGSSCYSHREPCCCCYEPMKVDDIELNLPCKHQMHIGCLWKWCQSQQSQDGVKTCPMCRAKLSQFYQWPKTFMTGRLFWKIDSKENATQFRQLIERYGGILAMKFADACDIILHNSFVGQGPGAFSEHISFLFELEPETKNSNMINSNSNSNNLPTDKTVRVTMAKSEMPYIDINKELVGLHKMLMPSALDS